MDDRRQEELANTYAQAALDYSRACEAFELASKLHRASVLAYFEAMRLRGDVKFDLPLSELTQNSPKFEI
jgi:hypothetical protein|tara:strand:- start:1375 stop:1584 length:210 start_codon:yes stop_codon:yes gene_type:complete